MSHSGELSNKKESLRIILKTVLTLQASLLSKSHPSQKKLDKLLRRNNFRLKLTFSCMMELNKYPLDDQICTMEIASCKSTELSI